MGIQIQSTLTYRQKIEVVSLNQSFLSELLKVTGFHRLKITSNHLQTNGLIERTHKTLKTAIIARKEP